MDPVTVAAATALINKALPLVIDRLVEIITEQGKDAITDAEKTRIIDQALEEVKEN